MKITIIVGSRFHSLDLVNQLQKCSHDIQLITFYPKFKIRRFGIRMIKIKSFPIIEYYIRIHKKVLGYFPRNYMISEIFDYWASRKINADADVYIIWAGYALHCIERIKKINPKAKIILERGSAHIIEQSNLLKGLHNKELVDPKMIKKELKEYNLVDFISLPGKFAKRTFVEHGINENKLVLNPYGVSLDGFKSLENSSRSENFVVGYVGVMSAQKNVKGLIEACRSIYEVEKDINLLLVGPIDNKTFNSELLNEPFIIYQKAVPQVELMKFYNRMDLFVLNSIQEGFGMVILQALACGVPVIATVNSGGLDVIKENMNGRTIEIQNNSQLSNNIRDLKNDLPQLKKMSNYAVESIKEGYTWDDYGRRYCEFLNTIHG